MNKSDLMIALSAVEYDDKIKMILVNENELDKFEEILIPDSQKLSEYAIVVNEYEKLIFIGEE